MTTHDLLTLAIGLVLGAVSAMFGIGGALVGTVLLNSILGMPPKLALATPLPPAVPSAISGSIAYRRAGLIHFPLVWRTVLAATPATFLGGWVASQLPGWVLMAVSGLLLLWSSLTFLMKALRSRREEAGSVSEESRPTTPEMTPRAWGFAVLAGFTSGVLAIGGGMVLVPLFTRVLRLPIKHAIATSLACVALLSIPTVIIHQINQYIDWRTAGLLSITVIPSSWVTARFAARLKGRTVELIYAIAMSLLALYFVVKSIIGEKV